MQSEEPRGKDLQVSDSDQVDVESVDPWSSEDEYIAIQNDELQAAAARTPKPKVLLWIELHDTVNNHFSLAGPYIDSRDEKKLAAEDLCIEVDDLDVIDERGAWKAINRLLKGAEFVQPNLNNPQWVWQLISGSGGPEWDIVEDIKDGDAKYLWTVCERLLHPYKPVTVQGDETILETFKRHELIDTENNCLRLPYGCGIHSYISLEKALAGMLDKIKKDLVPPQQHVQGKEDELLQGALAYWVVQDKTVVRLLTMKRHAITTDGRSNSMKPKSKVRETDDMGFRKKTGNAGKELRGSDLPMWIQVQPIQGDEETEYDGCVEWSEVH